MAIINYNNDNSCNKNKKGIVLLSIVGLVLTTSILCFSSMAYAQIPSLSNGSVADNVSGTAKMKQTRNDLELGSIASLQNNESGQQTWLLTGRWNMSKTTTDLPIFNASFTMIKLDGSMKHKHTISNKDTSNGTMTGNTTSDNITFNGTATVSMDKGSFVRDVPVSIKLRHSIMSLWVDPDKVGNHFGNTPIYGSVRGG